MSTPESTEPTAQNTQGPPNAQRRTLTILAALVIVPLSAGAVWLAVQALNTPLDAPAARWSLLPGTVKWGPYDRRFRVSLTLTGAPFSGPGVKTWRGPLQNTAWHERQDLKGPLEPSADEARTLNFLSTRQRLQHRPALSSNMAGTFQTGEIGQALLLDASEDALRPIAHSPIEPGCWVQRRHISTWYAMAADGRLGAGPQASLALKLKPEGPEGDGTVVKLRYVDRPVKLRDRQQCTSPELSHIDRMLDLQSGWNLVAVQSLPDPQPGRPGARKHVERVLDPHTRLIAF